MNANGNGFCVNCNSRKISRPRLLCWTCYFTSLGAREIAPMSKYDSSPERRAARVCEIDYYGPSKLPAQPTAALPGSEEKILVLIDRASRGESLWHPEDAKEDQS